MALNFEVRASVQAGSLEAAIAVLDRLDQNSRNFTPVLQGIATQVFQAIQDVYESEGSVWYGGWDPNQGQYGEEKRGLGLPIGVWTGELKADLTMPNALTSVGTNELVIGSDIVYAGKQQTGFTVTRRNRIFTIPARPPMPEAQWWGQSFGQEWADMISVHILDGVVGKA